MKLQKTILVLSLVVIVLSMFVLLKPETLGYSVLNSSTSTINVSIEKVVAINFSVDDIDFGSGDVIPGDSYATIDTLGNAVGGSFTPVNGGLQLDNLGNTNVTITLQSDKTAEEFIGGTNPHFEYMVTNKKLGSCSVSGFNLGQWYEVNTTEPGTLICNSFSSIQSNNSVRVDIRLTIPSDSMLGRQTNTFTATATG